MTRRPSVKGSGWFTLSARPSLQFSHHGSRPVRQSPVSQCSRPHTGWAGAPQALPFPFRLKPMVCPSTTKLNQPVDEATAVSTKQLNDADSTMPGGSLRCVTPSWCISCCVLQPMGRSPAAAQASQYASRPAPSSWTAISGSR